MYCSRINIYYTKFHPQPFPESSLVDLVEVFQGVGGSGLNGGGVRLPVSRANLKMKFRMKCENIPSNVLRLIVQLNSQKSD